MDSPDVDFINPENWSERPLKPEARAKDDSQVPSLALQAKILRSNVDDARVAPPQSPIGAVYTPEPLVRWMVKAVLAEVDAKRTAEGSPPLRIVDPACGDGAFLMVLLEELIGTESSSHSALRLLGTSLFGVDTDAVAVSVLNKRITQRLGSRGAPSADIEAGCQRNILVGDALTGHGFGEEGEVGDKMVTAPSDGIDWAGTFPAVAAQGGFDIVIGNPPYLREKDAKAVFDRITATPLGRGWSQPRMDLSHYFVHRGLDLLRPGGTLCFIVNSYWMAAISARRMIQRLREETTLRRIVLLGDVPLFPGVAGRHMILQLTKGRREQSCEVVDLSAQPDPLTLLTGSPAAVVPWKWCQSQDSLFVGLQVVAFRPRPSARQMKGRQSLEDEFLVRQGIAENPPRVTRRMSQESGETLTPGAGVFVLTSSEVAGLGLSDIEREHLRPTFPRHASTASLSRWSRRTGCCT